MKTACSQLALLLAFVLAVQPAFARTSYDISESGGNDSSSTWNSHWHVGPWYSRYQVSTPQGGIDQPGLLSLVGGLDSQFDFNPVYLGLNADFYTPQILWKSIGLGLFYFACFVVTGGNCNEHPSFATGERDAGMLSGGASVGVNFHDFTTVPVRVYGGSDFGLFYSGLTPRPFSTLYVKGGVAVDIGDGSAIDFSVRRSVWMRQWDFGQYNGVNDPAVWIVGLNFVWRR